MIAREQYKHQSSFQRILQPFSLLVRWTGQMREDMKESPLKLPLHSARNPSKKRRKTEAVSGESSIAWIGLSPSLARRMALQPVWLMILWDWQQDKDLSLFPSLKTLTVISTNSYQCQAVAPSILNREYPD